MVKRCHVNGVRDFLSGKKKKERRKKKKRGSRGIREKAKDPVRMPRDAGRSEKKEGSEGGWVGW